MLEDIDDVYYNRKTQHIFITDDNMVLDPERVIALCDAIIARKYDDLRFAVQADCVTMAKQEKMVEKMAEAGFFSIFLGIENGYKKNLASAGKGDITGYARKAIENCHKHGMMVIGGLIFGFPEDDEDSIAGNYSFFRSLGADAAYCQILTPYPKTGMREQLLEKELITNKDDYKKYNGLWANVKTRFLDTEQLQYQFWYQRQIVLGWWNPSSKVKRKGWFWLSIWSFFFKPMLKIHFKRIMKKYGWEGRYQREVNRWEQMNSFPDLEGY